jgi:hypothetical protein
LITASIDTDHVLKCPKLGTEAGSTFRGIGRSDANFDVVGDYIDEGSAIGQPS